VSIAERPSLVAENLSAFSGKELDEATVSVTKVISQIEGVYRDEPDTMPLEMAHAYARLIEAKAWLVGFTQRTNEG
jgi:hypothetical protein